MLSSILSTKPTINIGYVALLDAAPLIIAQKLGFFAEEDVIVKLHRESNWASIRDKLSLGLFDAAHTLAPMVFASQIKAVNAVQNKAFKTSLALGYNGNAITLSNELINELSAQNDSLNQVSKKLKAYSDSHEKPLVFGTVYPHSMHTYLLHLLLREANIDSARVEIKVFPPIRMVQAMKDREVDLFCVGEPWNTAAQIEEAGKIICYGSDLWSYAPEKVLAVNAIFAEKNPKQHVKIVRAVIRACQWLEEPDHMAQAALWLALPEYLNCSSDLLIRAMINQWPTMFTHKEQRKLFFKQHATMPWPEHAQWILSAIIQFNKSTTNETLEAIDHIYDSSVYSEAMESLGIKMPNSRDLPGIIPKI